MTKFGAVVCAILVVLSIIACICLIVFATNYESIKELVSDVLETIDMIKNRKKGTFDGKRAKSHRNSSHNR